MLIFGVRFILARTVDVQIEDVRCTMRGSSFATDVAKLFSDTYIATESGCICDNSTDIANAVSNLVRAITTHVHYDDEDIVPDDLYADLMDTFISLQDDNNCVEFVEALRCVF